MISRRLLTLFAAALLPLSACQSTPGGFAGVVERLLPVLATFADGAVRLYLTEAAHDKAPQLLALLDTNHDGTLELAELTGAEPTPELAVVVLWTVEQLLRHPDNPAPPQPAGGR